MPTLNVLNINDHTSRNCMAYKISHGDHHHQELMRLLADWAAKRPMLLLLLIEVSTVLRTKSMSSSTQAPSSSPSTPRLVNGNSEQPHLSSASSSAKVGTLDIGRMNDLLVYASKCALLGCNQKERAHL